MLRTYRVMVALILIVIVEGCWIPEKFTARIVVHEDGSYTYTYDGILTFALALAAAKEGKLTPKDEAVLKKEEEAIRREPGFKKVSYSGNGRYDVFVERTCKAGEPTFFVSRETMIFSIVPKQDGTIEISSFKLTEKDLIQLRNIGATVNGYLKVSVDKGVEVVKHNVSSTPKFFGLFGDYEWHIKSPDAAPYIYVRPSS